MVKSRPSKRWIICDLCDGKFHLDQMKLIKDKYNLLYGLMVCPKDVEKTNPQNTPFYAKKEHTVNPQLVRPESTTVNYLYITDAEDIDSGSSEVIIGGTLASAPHHLVARTVSSSVIQFQWQGPDSLGSGRLLGWAVKRESPLGGGFSVLTSNSGEVDQTYTDGTVSSNTQYNYQVACVTTVGIGTYSDNFTVTT